jgi:hypothetical protein
MLSRAARSDERGSDVTSTSGAIGSWDESTGSEPVADAAIGEGQAMAVGKELGVSRAGGTKANGSVGGASGLTEPSRCLRSGGG